MTHQIPQRRQAFVHEVANVPKIEGIQQTTVQQTKYKQKV